MALSESLRPSLLFWYGQVLTLFKRHARALEVFRTVTRENPRHQQAWSCIGFLLAEREELQPAIEDFERALALNPADAASHFNVGYGLGLSLAQLGRLEEGAGKFQEAASLQPMNPYAGYQLAGVWHRLGRRDKVRAEYDRIKGFDPKVAERIRTEFGVR
jgi:tetratricopeptide (TPR) repeat protein